MIGDHALDALTEAIENEDDLDSYRSGAMTMTEAFERGICNHRGFPYLPGGGASTPRLPRRFYGCRHCGKQLLKWRKTDYGWRLHERNGRMHVCDDHPGVTCRHCGTTQLWWGDGPVDGRWRLHEGADVHECGGAGGER